MTNEQDSSAPNSPDLTRLSGEQAEERTAREGRLIRAQKFMSKKGIPNLPHIDHETRDDIYTDELLDAYAESECSRLASRVEELENRIAKHSGSLNSADSAARITSDPAAKEIRTPFGQAFTDAPFCRFCAGRGYVYNTSRRCEACQGTGRVSDAAR